MLDQNDNDIMYSLNIQDIQWMYAISFYCGERLNYNDIILQCIVRIFILSTFQETGSLFEYSRYSMDVCYPHSVSFD